MSWTSNPLGTPFCTPFVGRGCSTLFSTRRTLNWIQAMLEFLNKTFLQNHCWTWLYNHVSLILHKSYFLTSMIIFHLWCLNQRLLLAFHSTRHSTFDSLTNQLVQILESFLSLQHHQSTKISLTVHCQKLKLCFSLKTPPHFVLTIAILNQ